LFSYLSIFILIHAKSVTNNGEEAVSLHSKFTLQR